MVKHTGGMIPWGLLVHQKRYRHCDSNENVVI